MHFSCNIRATCVYVLNQGVFILLKNSCHVEIVFRKFNFREYKSFSGVCLCRKQVEKITFVAFDDMRIHQRQLLYFKIIKNDSFRKIIFANLNLLFSIQKKCFPLIEQFSLMQTLKTVETISQKWLFIKQTDPKEQNGPP